MESEPCFFCLFIFGLLILFFCGRGLYSDYSFYKNNNWNWDEIKNNDLRMDGDSINHPPPIKGPIRFLLYFLGLGVGLVFLVSSTFNMFVF